MKALIGRNFAQQINVGNPDATLQASVSVPRVRFGESLISSEWLV